MFFPDSFKLTTPSDREILVTRNFDAPRSLLFEAFTKPDIVRRWLLGPPGWTMPVCEIALSIGGSYRYVWFSEKDGSRMGVGGVFRDIVVPERLVATERFDDAWYPGEAVITTAFAETRGVTTVSIRVLYESTDARDMARRSGMEHGMAFGFSRLEHDIATQSGERA
ncbi:MAG: SRPBCC family protein [Pseudomonadota bacterium]